MEETTFEERRSKSMSAIPGSSRASAIAASLQGRSEGKQMR
jgi:hypothetical protein